MNQPANNSLRIKLRGMSLIQTEDGLLLSDYDDKGDDLHYPNLTNAQANFISTEIKKRSTAALVKLIEDLAENKAQSVDIAVPKSGGKPA